MMMTDDCEGTQPGQRWTQDMHVPSSASHRRRTDFAAADPRGMVAATRPVTLELLDSARRNDLRLRLDEVCQLVTRSRRPTT